MTYYRVVMNGTPAQIPSGIGSDISSGASHAQGHGPSGASHTQGHGFKLVSGASHAQGHGGAPQLPGRNLPVSRGGAPVEFQVDNSEDEITFYKFDDDEDRPAPEWDSEEELSDLDP